MSFVFCRVMEFSVYGLLWIMLLFLAGLWFGKRTGVLWQYFVAVCIAVHLLVPVHIQWLSLDMPFVQEQQASFYKNGEQFERSVSDRAATYTAMKKAEKTVSDKERYETVTRETGEMQNCQEQKLLQGDTSFVCEEKSDMKAAALTEQKNNRKSSEHFIGKIQIKKDFWLELLEKIWCLGMLLYFGRVFISYVAFRKMVKRWSLPAKPMAHQILEQVKLQYGVRRKIELKRNGKLTSPVLHGLLRPVILLPDMSYSEMEYRYIFQHELSHYKHGDILLKYVFTLCQGVYWFHPMVHWMCRRAFWQMEFLCDEAVVRGKETEEKRAYSMVLLKHMLSGGTCKTIPLTTSFYGGKECMKMRFQNIMDKTKKKAGIGAILAATVFVIAFGGVKWSTAREQTDGFQKAEVQKIMQAEGKDRKILVVGTDASSAAAGSADALLLVDVNGTNGTITVENVPRELGVDFKEVAKTLDEEEIKNIDNLGKGKLSAAYFYGCEMLVGSVEYLYQVEIDSYLVVNYEAVSSVIDAAGGVEVTLTGKEAKYLNRTNYISKKKYRNVKAGKQVLNGDQAVGYMRVRKPEAGSPVVNGKNTTKKDSFARISRCSNVLYALADAVKDSNVDWAEMIYSLVEGKTKEEIEVNISVEELIALAEKLVSGEFTIEEAKEADTRRYVEKVGDIGQYLVMDSEAVDDVKADGRK